MRIEHAVLSCSKWGLSDKKITFLIRVLLPRVFTLTRFFTTERLFSVTLSVDFTNILTHVAKSPKVPPCGLPRALFLMGVRTFLIRSITTYAIARLFCANFKRTYIMTILAKN